MVSDPRFYFFTFMHNITFYDYNVHVEGSLPANVCLYLLSYLLYELYSLASWPYVISLSHVAFIAVTCK